VAGENEFCLPPVKPSAGESICWKIVRHFSRFAASLPPPPQSVKHLAPGISRFRPICFVIRQPASLIFQSISNLGFLCRVPFHFRFLFQSISLSILISMNFNFHLGFLCKLSCCYCWIMFVTIERDFFELNQLRNSMLYLAMYVVSYIGFI
jgi:hypothetical protein